MRSHGGIELSSHRIAIFLTVRRRHFGSSCACRNMLNGSIDSYALVLSAYQFGNALDWK